MDDPTLFVIKKMQDVLVELNVTVEKYNLFELKNSITTLPQTIKEADGVILATTVEWYGIGGYMNQFLDALWLYGDKEKISNLYMCPVVMSTTYGEREAKLNLSIAWEILGGRPCSGICGYFTDTIELEMNEEYSRLIEKKAENLYRSINQRITSFPASNQVVKQMVSSTKNVNFTPQETEQLSQYVSDDSYMATQKEDIRELSSLFKEMIGSTEVDDTTAFVKEFEGKFKPQPGFKATYKFLLKEKKKPLIIQVANGDLKCFYGNVDKQDVEIQLASQTMEEIISARMTFQRAFMGGDMKMKGDFKVLRTLDQIFPFMDEKSE